MDTVAGGEPVTRTALEDFLRDYVETIGGAWDEIEPQVYDLLLPAEGNPSLLDAAASGVLRVTFDPEALPEHPRAQLASFGTPFVNGLLADAEGRGRFAEFAVVGLNLTPHDLPAQVHRAITLADGLTLRIEQVRPLLFPQAVYWFEAEFISDQKEQAIVPVALDLHYGRQVRHLEELLDPGHLSEQLAQPLPEVRRLSVAAAYPQARERALRTFATLANTRNRELTERLERQVRRMEQYYADLRSEVSEQETRARTRGEDLAKYAARREALEREERLRVAELRQKNTLRIHLRLLQLLVLQQPKLLVRCRIAGKKASALLELVWDPLVEAVEAAPCPVCGRPTFAFALTRLGQLACPACAEREASGGRARRR